VDLFPAHARSAERRRPRPALLPWSSALPMSSTPRGVRFIDAVRAEEMSVALTGDPSAPDAARFLDVLSREMAEGRLALRVFSLKAPSPGRVSRGLHLSSRMQQLARDVMDAGEDRGASVRLPFSATFTKRRPAGTLRHGHLCVRRGFDLAVVDGRRVRTTVADWPELEYETRAPEPPPHGCPLVVGDSDWSSSWTHLAAGRGCGLAVWPTDSPRLWVFKEVESAWFPGPFDAVQRSTDDRSQP